MFQSTSSSAANERRPASALVRGLAGALVALGLVAAPLSGAKAQGTPVKTPLRVAYVPVITWLPSWIAKDRGFFDLHGLDVTLSPIQNLSLLPPTMGRQFDIAASTAPDLLKAAASGLDVVAVSGETVEVTANQSFQIIVRPDSGIRSVQDLKGKLIASPTIGAVMHVATLYWLKAGGVDPNGIRAIEVPFPNMGDQLKAGRVDALELLHPFVGQQLAAGNVSIGNPLLAVADPALFTFWIAQGAWARANPAVIERWIASLKDARQFLETNPTESRAILAKYTRLPDAVAQKIPFPAYDTSLNAAQLEVWVKVLRELGQLSAPVDASRLVVTARQ
jgi:ABC-type nitrate/sulfonate/bicarbonate transport system substrate-binding protein